MSAQTETVRFELQEKFSHSWESVCRRDSFKEAVKAKMYYHEQGRQLRIVKITESITESREVVG